MGEGPGGKRSDGGGDLGVPLGWLVRVGPRNGRGLREALAEGADPNQIDGAEMTPLGWAAAGGKLEELKLLLAHGADPSAAAHPNSTPLAWAVSEGRWACAAALAEAVGGWGAAEEQALFRRFGESGWRALDLERLAEAFKEEDLPLGWSAAAAERSGSLPARWRAERELSEIAAELEGQASGRGDSGRL